MKVALPKFPATKTNLFRYRGDGRNVRMTEPPPATAPSPSAWSPFKIGVFRALWLATLASNIGTWMHDIGAGWLMTSLTPSPVMVALVQSATTLPIFLLALPAGALADIIDRRRQLIGVQLFLALVAALLSVVAIIDFVTPWLLLALTFCMGIGAALMMPAWAGIVPELVPREQLPAAIALNSMGINVARAIGPAIAGLIVAAAGTGAVFALNALSYSGVIFVLLRWQHQREHSQLPAERLFSAMRSGLRFVRHSPELQAAAMRGLGFFLFASASWALLPLIAKGLTDGGPQSFGVLVAAVGAGAVCGALLLPRLRHHLSRDALVACATLLYAACLAALARLDTLWQMVPIMALSGIAWITVLSSLQVAAQLALPNWVRSRGLAVFMSVFMGAMALGSLIWGKLAALHGIGAALDVAAFGAVVAVLATRRWHISGADTLDFTPAMHWPCPPQSESLHHDRGPVLVTIEYDVKPDQVEHFLQHIAVLGKHRRQHGVFSWSVFEHTERPNQFIETFNDESWLAHLRQHERVPVAVHNIQQQIQSLLADGSQPRVTHYVAPEF